MQYKRLYTNITVAFDCEARDRLREVAYANCMSSSGFLRQLFNNYEQEQAAKAAKEAKKAARAAKAKAKDES